MTVLDDPSLIARARGGDAEAYGQLYERHVGVALGVARRITDHDAEDVVSDAFARTFAVLRDGGGPDVAFRPYVLRAVRNAAVDRHRREGRVDPVGTVDEAQTPLHQDRESGDPVVDRLERELAVRAFDSLPERWRTVLWHTEVQGEAPAQVAPLLGISPRAVAQLAVRAREGLRTAWLREHAQHVPAGHQEVVAMLAPSVRSSLGRRDRRALDEHLAACPGCRRVQDELVEVNSTLRAAVLPAVVGLTAAQLGWLGPTAGHASAGTAGAGTAAGTVDAPTGGEAGGAGAGGGAATAGEGGAGGTGAGSAGGHGLAAAAAGALSHPVAVGAVALAVAATGLGGYALWDTLREPRTAQVGTAPTGSVRTPSSAGGPADRGAGPPTGSSGAPAPSAPPASGTGTGEAPPSTAATSAPSPPGSASSGPPPTATSSSSVPSCGQGGAPAPSSTGAPSAAPSGPSSGPSSCGSSPSTSSSSPSRSSTTSSGSPSGSSSSGPPSSSSSSSGSPTPSASSSGRHATPDG